MQRAFLASLPNQFCCPALAWKEQPVTEYSIISQIPGASNTCYTLLESVKSTLSGGNSYLFIFNFLVHEVQLPFFYNSDSTSARLLWSAVVQISNRLVLHWMKTQGEIFQKYQCSSMTLPFLSLNFSVLWTYNLLARKIRGCHIMKKEIGWFPASLPFLVDVHVESPCIHTEQDPIIFFSR